MCCCDRQLTTSGGALINTLCCEQGPSVTFKKLGNVRTAQTITVVAQHLWPFRSWIAQVPRDLSGAVSDACECGWEHVITEKSPSPHWGVGWGGGSYAHVVARLVRDSPTRNTRGALYRCKILTKIEMCRINFRKSPPPPTQILIKIRSAASNYYIWNDKHGKGKRWFFL